MKEYAVYRGDNLLVIGTAKECAAELNMKPESIRWLTTPTAKQRLAKRKHPERCVVVDRLED